MAFSLNINAGLVNVIPKDMLAIPWNLSSPRTTCSCWKNIKMVWLETKTHDWFVKNHNSLEAKKHIHQHDIIGHPYDECYC